MTRSNNNLPYRLLEVGYMLVFRFNAVTRSCIFIQRMNRKKKGNNQTIDLSVIANKQQFHSLLF